MQGFIESMERYRLCMSRLFDFILCELQFSWTLNYTHEEELAFLECR